MIGLDEVVDIGSEDGKEGGRKESGIGEMIQDGSLVSFIVLALVDIAGVSRASVIYCCIGLYVFGWIIECCSGLYRTSKDLGCIFMLCIFWLGLIYSSSIKTIVDEAVSDTVTRSMLMFMMGCIPLCCRWIRMALRDEVDGRCGGIGLIAGGMMGCMTIWIVTRAEYNSNYMYVLYLILALVYWGMESIVKNKKGVVCCGGY